MPATLPINTPKDKTPYLGDTFSDLWRDTCIQMGDYDRPLVVNPQSYHFVAPLSLREKLDCGHIDWPGGLKCNWERTEWNFMGFEVVFREGVYSIDLVPYSPIVPDDPLPFDEVAL